MSSSLIILILSNNKPKMKTQIVINIELFTLRTNLYIMERSMNQNKDMVSVHKYGLMGPNMRDPGSSIRLMASEN